MSFGDSLFFKKTRDLQTALFTENEERRKRDTKKLLQQDKNPPQHILSIHAKLEPESCIVLK
jgi:hypothetical protein